MIIPDYGTRLLISLAKDVALTVACVVFVPPMAVTLGILAVLVREMPQPAGRGPRRRDEF